MKTALRVGSVSNADGDAGVYRLSEPLIDTEYVLVSAIPYCHDTDEPETLIFACNQYGRVTETGFEYHLCKVANSMDHGLALAKVGYEIARLQ